MSFLNAIITLASHAPPPPRNGTSGGQVAGSVRGKWETSGGVDAEQLADVIGLAMSAITPADIARMVVYLTREIECEDVWVMPGITAPIPVVGGII